MSKKEQTARGLALTILQEIFEEGAYSNLVLQQALSGSQLSDKDKGLVTEIVYGTVSRKLTLEWYLAHLIPDREKLDSWVYYLLMLSLYQLLYLDKIPSHAVVHEAVNLAKKGKTGADKYVNALLRKLLSEPLPDIGQIKRVNKRLSIAYSVPVWLVRILQEEYGVERTTSILDSLQQRSKVSARVVDPTQLSEIQAALEAEPSRLSQVGLVKASGHLAGTDYFQQGLLAIQDETSQLVAPTLGLVGHEQVLDACAAPGGKTAHIASYLTTGQVLALDLYDHKLRLIQENAERLGVADKVQTQKLDARQVAKTFGANRFDRILVDAPCSGIGLIRRKPDIRYNKANQDSEALRQIQLEILDSVCQTVKKGGIITYSTCTIIGRENQEVLQTFLEMHPNFEQVPLTHPCQDIVRDGYLCITPEQYGTDGFFIGQVRRKS